MKYNLKVVLQYFKECGLPEPTPEFVFHPERKWRFDFAFIVPDERLAGLCKKLALEVEGGIFMRKGGHNSISGIKRDMEKYNEAAALGWRVVRVRPDEVCMLDTVKLLRRCLNV